MGWIHSQLIKEIFTHNSNVFQYIDFNGDLFQEIDEQFLDEYKRRYEIEGFLELQIESNHIYMFFAVNYLEERLEWNEKNNPELVTIFDDMNRWGEKYITMDIELRG